MYQQADILTFAHRQPLMQEDLDLLLHVDRAIPGSVNYSIKRYRKQPQWNIDDTGVLVYHYEKNNPGANSLELRFCVSGNLYCREKHTECDFCKFNSSGSCVEKIESVDVLSFRFTPTYLAQFTKNSKFTTLTEEVLAFNHQSSFSRRLTILTCRRARNSQQR